jgi:8-hydroxy-5-deazaflavin:NADPH oxidoreductase
MSTTGFIGSGNIGGTVAGLAAAAGYHVVLSNSRGPQTLQDLAAEIGPLASAGTAEVYGPAGVASGKLRCGQVLGRAGS